MNRKWIYCMTLICQQRIENSIVYKKWWKKTIRENLVSTNILVKKLFTTKNYFRDLYLQNLFTKVFIQGKWTYFSQVKLFIWTN